jgi:hypothetical protein
MIPTNRFLVFLKVKKIRALGQIREIKDKGISSYCVSWGEGNIIIINIMEYKRWLSY